MRGCFPTRFRDLWLCVMVMLVVMGTTSAFGAETKSTPNGRSNFESKCARCHGAGGKGNGFQAMALFFMFKMPDLTDSAYMKTRSDDVLFRAIKQGSKGGMPAFGLKLSDPEIKDLVAYVRGFSGAR